MRRDATLIESAMTPDFVRLSGRSGTIWSSPMAIPM